MSQEELIKGLNKDLAGELGLVELQVKLEEMAADEAGHACELRRLIGGL